MIGKWFIRWMALSILKQTFPNKSWSCMSLKEAIRWLFLRLKEMKLQTFIIWFGFSENDYLVSYSKLDGDELWRRWSWRRFVCVFLILTIPILLVTISKGNMVITQAADSKSPSTNVSNVLPRQKEICISSPLTPLL